MIHLPRFLPSEPTPLRLWRYGLVGLLLVIGASMHARPAVAGHEPTQFVDPPGRQSVPRTDGTTVIWLDFRSEDGEPDLYGARLSDGEEFPIATEALALTHADIDGDVVVWAEAPCAGCPRDIMGLRLESGERFSVTNSPNESDGEGTAISGRWVVWVSVDEAGNKKLRARDIESMGEVRDLATIGGGSPVFDGERIFWEDPDIGEGKSGIYTMRLDDSSPTLLVEFEALSVTGIPGSFGYDVAGDTVIYIDGLFRWVATNVVTGAMTTLQARNYDQNPTTDGRYVIWEVRDTQPRDADGDRKTDLVAYDLQTDSTFVVAAGSVRDESPDLQDGVLVWSSGDDTDAAIHAAELSDLLPSAPRADPEETSPDWQYFPETGHYLGGGFRSFWESNGGLQVFGYPLTEEFQELDADVDGLPVFDSPSIRGLQQNIDTDAFHAVQYFERQRYEWHSEHEGTDYEVLLGRLGAELLEMDGQDWRDLPTAEPSAPHYFPETGHATDERFYSYWSNHGLDLGDEGVSFRESLALFGYPISEPMTETNADGDTVLTQYFERAVFEWHPENAGTPYEVLLRRVGAEMLTARQW